MCPGRPINKKPCRYCGVMFLPEYTPINYCSKVCAYWDKVDKTDGLGPGGDCWEWKASLYPFGYGRFRLFGSDVHAHIVGYVLDGNPWPRKGQFVCHKCDNPKCVNPAHLFLGDAKFNMEDKVNKGRQARGAALTKAMIGKTPRGEAHPDAKLTEADVVKIFTGYQRGEQSMSAMAYRYGVHRKTVWRILTGQGWRHVVSRLLREKSAKTNALLIAEYCRRTRCLQEVGSGD